jgi:hypothetical protein
MTNLEKMQKFVWEKCGSPKIKTWGTIDHGEGARTQILGEQQNITLAHVLLAHEKGEFEIRLKDEYFEVTPKGWGNSFMWGAAKTLKDQVNIDVYFIAQNLGWDGEE